jgi:hypothetical protein
VQQYQLAHGYYGSLSIVCWIVISNTPVEVLATIRFSLSMETMASVSLALLAMDVALTLTT